ncbi:tetratricopeptide repeat protein [Microseira sp. BLCC-F43]|jgi:serine/threonine protein kinase|uniref:protein kinase domain-containing protein n=1 Tax=Microseira sp. BLCC-F43 TaxID=3153602 RepID=UPI0035B90BED
MNLTPGEIIGGHYRILCLLGRGAFSQTYLAENLYRLNGAKCVVKQLQLIISSRLILENARHRFLREAIVLENLGIHAQIPRLLAYFEENQEFYLVQEYIDGCQVSKEIKEGKRWNEDQVIALLQDVWEILAFIHQHGALHRDIKPSNLIIRKSDGKIVIIDFGAVKEINTWAVNGKRQEKGTHSIGTAGYMPPEQLEGKPRFSSDIYGLGMTAIHALTGILPAEIQRDEKYFHLFWREQAGQVSNKLAMILEKMVCYYPGERYESATEVLRDLQNIKNSRKNYFVTHIAGRDIVIVGKNSSFGSQKNPLLVTLLSGFISFIAVITYIVNTILPRYQADNLYNQANELVSKQQYEAALQIYDQAIQINPEFYQALNRYLESLESCHQAIKINKNDVFAWNCQGIMLNNLGEYDRAIAAYDRAIKIDPKFEDAWNNKGQTLMQLHRYKEAIVAFDTAIKINPNYLFACNNKAISLSKLKRYDEALAAFDKAIQIRPDYQPAIEGRKQTIKQLGG